jgi:uncharacterized membrane protein
VASKEKNSSKLNFLNKILYGAIVIFIILVITYFIFIFNLDDEQKGNWGTFGDFIGGTLNPIFALFSLFAIIYTIKIQTKELELSREELEATRKELEDSRIAQQEQSESLKLQNEATKLQIFENTFFELVRMLNNIKESISIIPISLSNIVNGGQKFILNGRMYTTRIEIFEDLNKLYASEAISKYILILKELLDKDYNKFNNHYEKYTGTYFGQIYQILKYINESNIENKQRYVNIFRAQFTKDELELLFYHCLGSIGKIRFKKLVEDYEFFEHIILNEDIEKELLDYDENAFGKNEKILKRYEELKETK